MTAGASVERRERVRLFVGLPLPPEATARIAEWQASELAGHSGVRVVGAENLHATIAFLGSRPTADVAPATHAVRAAAAAAAGEAPVLTPLRYRETRSVGMIVFADDENRGTHLAEAVWNRLEEAGIYERERRPWLPHVTVARFRSRPRLRPAAPAIGPVSPSEVALYHSVLRPSGARYEILAAAPLGGSTS